LDAKKLILLAFLSFAAGRAPVWAQGLVDLVGGGGSGTPKPTKGVQTSRSASDGRLDLDVSPNIQALLGDPASRAVNLGASARWNPVCGKFDLKADFKALLGKEAREEYLEGFISAGVSELLGSGMELFCQSMPTACSILQNNNIAANLKLIYSNDLCTSIEEAVMSGARRGRAEALHRCIQEKQAQGKTKDEAERACLGEASQVTGFDGRVVNELDLGSEIRRYVPFSSGGSQLLDLLAQKRKVVPSQVSEDVRPNATAERYETLRNDFADKWAKALAASKGAGAWAPSEDELAALVPLSAPPVTKLELELLAHRSDIEVQSLVASVSAASALLALTREMNEVERKLEALRASPALDSNPEHVGSLDSILARLRSERERLLRLYSDQERLAGVLAAGHAAGQAQIARARMDTLRRAALGEATTRIQKGTRPFGTPDAGVTTGAGVAPSLKASAGASAQDCATCGLEYSIGGRP
jgi:hypothetical protein